MAPGGLQGDGIETTRTHGNDTISDRCYSPRGGIRQHICRPVFGSYHVLVLSEPHLRRTLARYFSYYHRARTHLSLDKDAPDGRPVEPPELGPVAPISEVGGLHHRYVRRAA